ncbi:MAG: carbohydrate kinase family protein [Anaerolineae bacterium]
METPIDVIVSGHLCLDLLPDMATVKPEALTMPGHLSESGPISISTGGAVSNTGLALQKLGVNVRLMAGVGNDLLGRVIIEFLQSRDPALSELISIVPDQPSSYTVVLSPLNADRTFIHCTGTNDIFGVDSINYTLLPQTRIFHLGYPPLLPRLMKGDGDETELIFKKAKETSVITSLDMTLPDANGVSGRVNWRRLLERTLPYVDIFLPSIEEVLFMLRREDYDRWKGKVLSHLTRRYLSTLADELLAMGVVIAGFKLGEMGMYLHTAKAADFSRVAALGLNLQSWAEARIYMPTFAVTVAGTTGAGDSAYAGFFAALLRGLNAEDALRFANAVGACNVEAIDSTSGVQSWEATSERIRQGWAEHSVRLPD